MFLAVLQEITSIKGTLNRLPQTLLSYLNVFFFPKTMNYHNKLSKQLFHFLS